MKLLYTLVLLAFVSVASAQITPAVNAPVTRQTPSAKVAQAFTTEQLNWKSNEDVTELNFRADHLVAVEPASKVAQADFQLKRISDGKSVVLPAADLVNFNPLLYTIPQDDLRCNNLYVASREGGVYLLVVLSKQQYQQQFNQFKRTQNAKH